ncbi:MAG TPA: hypothetical protein VK970_11235 [Candidatus Methylacidiphilales bacterium]|nr:hypothetical protein [Candidatus Methylacidiphilales bacterium]
MRKAGMEERALSDYVAAVLVAFAHTRQLAPPGPVSTPPNARSFTYISDMLENAAKAPPEQVFLIRSHIGNYSLFFSGIMPDRIQARVQRTGAPGIGFYEAVGGSSFAMAARHRQARSADLTPIYEQLSERFRCVRMALNQLAENLFHFHETPSILTRTMG